MARNRITLNRRDVGLFLRSAEMQAVIRAKAEQVAASVRSKGIRVGDRDGGRHEDALPVSVLSTVTDRAKALVTITHPAGDAVQAKHGVLTKAAAEAGLEVGRK